jgi:hypothetical protein
MVRECEAMLEYALNTGRVLPVEVFERFVLAVSLSEAGVPNSTADKRDDISLADTAIRSASEVVNSRFALLASAHAELAQSIAPATPETVRLMADEREKHPLWCAFGPLPLVRQMLGLALFSLVLLHAVALSEEISVNNLSKSVLELSGYPLLITEGFLISAASLGSCFANLQRINTVISNGTYDPRIQSTYWTRWVMGVISGIVLSRLVYHFFAQAADDTNGSNLPAIGRPILALLGGYSVDFVHGILRRTVNTLGNFFGITMDAGAEQRRGLASVSPEHGTAARQQAGHATPCVYEAVQRKRVEAKSRHLANPVFGGDPDQNPQPSP